jgi:alpha-glucoside transport system permease protein
MDQLAITLVAIVGGVGGMLLFYFGSNWLLDTFLADRVDADGIITRSRTVLRERIRPWFFVGPALILLTIFLVYPAIQTIGLSFFDDTSRNFVGLENYTWAFQDSGFQISIRNNIGWLIVVPFASTAIGLVVAVLADRVRWEALAKAFIFMPMAISFVGAAIIWRFMYAYKPEGTTQIGTLNAILVGLGGEPSTFYTVPPLNNLALMVILIWIQAGFAMVLLSAALKGVPDETLEAARIDGANEVQIFFRVMIPQIIPTLTVVMTTIIIVVLKIFDIVFTMTNGQFETEVLANYMFRWMFRNFDFGRGSMIAVTIMIAVTPFLVWNIVRFRREEQQR